MATLKQKLDIELKRLRDAESLLKSAKYQEKIQGDKVTAATKKALSEAPKKIEEAKKRVAAAEKALAEKKAEEKKATLTPQQKAVKNEADVMQSLSFAATDNKLINQLKADLGGQFNPEAFAQGGVGANIFVYQGTKDVKGVAGPGGVITSKKDNIALVSDIINSYWTDKNIQKKVLSALIASGNSDATQLDAFATWQSVVQQSAQLYNAGRGPKFTPFDVLDMSIVRAGGAKPDVTTYLDVPKDMELKQILKIKLSPLLRMEPKDDDPTFQSFFNDIKALYQKGETVTTTVDPKTGKKIQKRTGGVTDAMVQAKIDKYYNENNQDFLEAKSLDATDYFSQWMRS
jgi:ElaB/YqjD/DUF883 family membrane-anchored ribosome-binding protein